MYGDDSNSSFPCQNYAEGQANYEDWYRPTSAAGGWTYKLYPYVRTRKAYQCPVSVGFWQYGKSPWGNCGYLMNGVFCCTNYMQQFEPRKRDQVRSPSKVILIWENGQSTPWSRAYPNRTLVRAPYFDCGSVDNSAPITTWHLRVHGDTAMYVFLDCHARAMDVQMKYSMFDDRCTP